VKPYLRSLIVGIACFALGAAAQRYYDSRLAPASGSTTLFTENHVAGPTGPIHFEVEPLWAYGFERPPEPGEKASPQNPPTRDLRPNEDANDQTRPRHLEGSQAAYSLVDVRDGQNVIDWFPGDHPPMPDVIAHGPARLGKTRRGCGSCHLPNGKGRPENAPPAALPLSYFVRQIQDFRSGLRRSADPRKPNTNTMIDLARAMTDDEMRAAAEYFAALPYSPWIRVVETELVPKTKIVGNLFLPIEQEKTEPIAGRIIEVPEDVEQAETYRNPHSGFVAYVPVGSVEKGRDLVTTGGMKIVDDQIVQGKTTACGTCHGIDLTGVADVPPIAGRSPSYMARQMWDMQQGTRNGTSAQLMKLVVARLTPDDLLAIAAYVASRPPFKSVDPQKRLTQAAPSLPLRFLALVSPNAGDLDVRGAKAR
jgi:cytochrome c553